MIEAWLSRSVTMRVVGAEQRLEHAAVGVEAGGVEDRVLDAEEGGDAALQLAVEGLRAADEAHARHAVAPLVERAVGGGEQLGVAGEAEVVVRAEVQHGLGAARPRGSPGPGARGSATPPSRGPGPGSAPARRRGARGSARPCRPPRSCWILVCARSRAPGPARGSRVLRWIEGGRAHDRSRTSPRSRGRLRTARRSGAPRAPAGAAARPGPGPAPNPVPGPRPDPNQVPVPNPAPQPNPTEGPQFEGGRL